MCVWWGAVGCGDVCVSSVEAGGMCLCGWGTCVCVCGFLAFDVMSFLCARAHTNTLQEYTSDLSGSCKDSLNTTALMAPHSDVVPYHFLEPESFKVLAKPFTKI